MRTNNNAWHDNPRLRLAHKLKRMAIGDTTAHGSLVITRQAGGGTRGRALLVRNGAFRRRFTGSNYADVVDDCVTAIYDNNWHEQPRQKLNRTVGTTEAGQIANASRWTIHSWIRKGYVDAARRGQRWLIDLQSLKRHIERSRD